VRALTTSVVVALAVLTARPASAQQQTPPPGQQDPNAPVRVLTQRPYRGVFGSGYSETEQILTLGLNIGGGYDSSVFVDNRQDPNATTPLGRSKSGFGSGSANINYSLNRQVVSFSAGAGGALSYYPAIDDPYAHRYFADVGASWRISTGAGLSASYSAAYRPLQHLSSLPGVIDPTLGPGNPFDATIGAQAETYRNENADIGFSYRINQKIGTSFGYGMWRVVSPDRDRDVATHGASARVSVGLTKGLAFYTGYRISTTSFDNPAAASTHYNNHNIDFGLYFSKALSLTRKTTMSFGTGTSAVTDGNQTHYGLVGNVRVVRELARTWHASAVYSRDVQFAQAFRQPVSTDAVSLLVGGLISRRLRFDAGTGLASGKVGLGSADNGYRAVSTSAGLGMAINRFLSGGLRYSYTRYRFDGGVDLPLDLLFQSDRHGVNVYLSTWLPLFSRSRRP
jgi:hypothetical protein